MIKGHQDDVFNWKSLPAARLKDVCPDFIFMKLAIEIYCWEPFAMYLGLSSAKLAEIQMNSRNYLDQKIKSFIEWKKQNGSRATYYKLFECFEFFERRDLIEVLIPLCLDQQDQEDNTGM